MKILKELNLDDVVVLDIETTRLVDKLDLDSDLGRSWEYKQRYSREAEKFEGSLEEQFEQKAALYAEFAKIVCITIGKIKGNKLVLKSYKGHDEKELLIEFCDTLNKLCAKNKYTKLATHAGTGFDIPFMMRRCLINGIELPNLLDTAHLKPWELTGIDTLTLWRSTGFYGASLLNIATALGIPSSKTDITGAETSNVYWRENGLDRIVKYCQADVLCLANIIRKIRGESLLEPELSDIKVEKTPLMEKIFNSGKVTEEDKKDIDDVMNMLEDHEKDAANDILQATLPKTKKINKK